MAHTLDRLAGSGDLPLAPFDEGSRDSLLMPLSQPLEHYFSLLAECGTAPQQEIRLNAGPLQIEDWLTGAWLRANAQRLVLHTGKLKERFDKLTRDWTLHLAACAAGHPLTTHPGTGWPHHPAPPESQRRPAVPGSTGPRLATGLCDPARGLPPPSPG